MTVNYEALLFGSVANFERMFLKSDRSGNYILDGKEYIDPEGNSIRRGVKTGLYERYEEKGIFWNGHLIIDETWIPPNTEINLANIRRTIDAAGTIRHGEIRDGKLLRGTLKQAERSYIGRFDSEECLLTGQFIDEEATVPDQAPEDPPFRLHLSFSNDSIDEGDHL